jgi:ferredoxin
LKTAGFYVIVIKLFPRKGVITMATPKVDMDLCIGCGLCAELCPKVFELRDDKAWVTDPKGCDTCDCQQAVDGCPVTAISME